MSHLIWMVSRTSGAKGYDIWSLINNLYLGPFNGSITIWISGTGGLIQVDDSSMKSFTWSIISWVYVTDT